VSASSGDRDVFGGFSDHSPEEHGLLPLAILALPRQRPLARRGCVHQPHGWLASLFGNFRLLESLVEIVKQGFGLAVGLDGDVGLLLLRGIARREVVGSVVHIQLTCGLELSGFLVVVFFQVAFVVRAGSGGFVVGGAHCCLGYDLKGMGVLLGVVFTRHLDENVFSVEVVVFVLVLGLQVERFLLHPVHPEHARVAIQALNKGGNLRILVLGRHTGRKLL